MPRYALLLVTLSLFLFNCTSYRHSQSKKSMVESVSGKNYTSLQDPHTKKAKYLKNQYQQINQIIQIITMKNTIDLED